MGTMDGDAAAQDMWELAEAGGLWNASAPKDFTATFSDGEYAHKYYSGRRMWGAFRLAAPARAAADLAPEYGDLKADAPYPFAVAVERKLGVRDVFAIHREWYAGTPYDLSAGMQAGFGGSPDRYNGCAGAACDNVTGNWERSIALWRTSDTIAVQARVVDPSCLALSCLVLSCLVLSCLVLSCLILQPSKSAVCGRRTARE